jgi:hypothetical protein
VKIQTAVGMILAQKHDPGAGDRIHCRRQDSVQEAGFTAGDRISVQEAGFKCRGLQSDSGDGNKRSLGSVVRMQVTECDS